MRIVAYVSDVAMTLNNLAVLYKNTQRFDQAEEYYLSALEIRERLAKAHPEVYGQDYAGCLHNASYFSLHAAILLQGRFEEAKQIYLTYKDDLRDAFLNDFQTLKDNNAIPEHLYGDVEKIIELLNS